MYRCAYTCICICVCMYACICTRVYVCMCIYVCLCICMHIHVYTHTCGCTYALVMSHFVYLYCPVSLLHACVSQVFSNTCMRVWERIGRGGFFSLFMVSACCWRGRLCFGRSRDMDFVLHISLFLQVGGYVHVYARIHTQTTWVPGVSPGVGLTPGQPEESRLTKAQYTCTPYMCTTFSCLYISETM